MAAGYLHNDACTALLAAGADITKKDRQGRDISGLLENLRGKMSTASAITQRMRLEEVSKALTYFTFEDVAPAAILDTRSVEGERQYLVQWSDDADDEWVPAAFVSPDVRLLPCFATCCVRCRMSCGERRQLSHRVHASSPIFNQHQCVAVYKFQGQLTRCRAVDKMSTNHAHTSLSLSLSRENTFLEGGTKGY